MVMLLLYDKDKELVTTEVSPLHAFPFLTSKHRLVIDKGNGSGKGFLKGRGGTEATFFFLSMQSVFVPFCMREELQEFTYTLICTNRNKNIDTCANMVEMIQ